MDIVPLVNVGAYMTFKEAVDSICRGYNHAEIANALGVSVASVRQYRLAESAKAHRNPPANWREDIIRLAERQILDRRHLIAELSNGDGFE